MQYIEDIKATFEYYWETLLPSFEFMPADIVAFIGCVSAFILVIAIKRGFTK